MSDRPKKHVPVSTPPERREPDPLDREQLSKLGLLVAGIAHNMNGPLTGMLGNIDLLKMMHPELKDNFDKIGKIGLRLREDIRIMMSKTVAEYRREVKPVDLPLIVREELEFYKADPRLKHQTEVEILVDGEIPTFIAVPGDFWQAFGDLITNSIEAMESKDERSLQIEVRLADEETIELQMRDNGVGMSDEVRARAFEPFFTTKTPKKEGKYPATLATGLGLTHVKNLMDPLGVEVELASRDGEGTTVTLRIPYKRIEQLYARPDGG